ncbi:hypothetical protein [Streptacidiphilus jiangxiensis]|uniref:Uncharacterized protein n=1 Tax=Streptacidiphilus jiangxiensis TaxID=235985 RepID=A0A1H7X055_STRJI|nr:hypothetical protein [Streptacidiphilus jiangxiensis]SEM26944.1 hypothetical protein SAMN05414137_12231 [Streptacidiphilus jiangxiensis]
MGRVKRSSVVVGVLAAALIGFWSWVLATPATVPDCPSHPAAGAVCLSSAAVRVGSYLPRYRYVLGLRHGIGPTYGVTVSGLPGGVRTIYLDRDGLFRLDPRIGQTVTASVLRGRVERLSDGNGTAWVSGYDPGFRSGWILGSVPLGVLLAVMARLDRRDVRTPRRWLWVDRTAALAALGSVVVVAFVRGRVEVGALVVCFGLLLAVETAGQRWSREPGD